MPMPLTLSTIEARILGCLIEKERTGPEYYPLTINALMSACNQLTNRDPIVGYDEKTIEAGLDSLREKKLVMIVHTAGARVPKYRHRFLEIYNLSSQELAIVCVLMLRGPQTSGELRARIERLSGTSALSEVERTLHALIAGEDPLVCVLPA
ncbi:MAG: YceH family protein, partial [Verrucomicrobia bacterium]|nr:YceH family protein [Verrucomicrobiota bacterium]